MFRRSSNETYNVETSRIKKLLRNELRSLKAFNYNGICSHLRLDTFCCHFRLNCGFLTESLSQCMFICFTISEIFVESENGERELGAVKLFLLSTLLSHIFYSIQKWIWQTFHNPIRVRVEKCHTIHTRIFFPPFVKYFCYTTRWEF